MSMYGAAKESEESQKFFRKNGAFSSKVQEKREPPRTRETPCPDKNLCRKSCGNTFCNNPGGAGRGGAEKPRRRKENG